jgi:hypothetical protein
MDRIRLEGWEKLPSCYDANKPIRLLAIIYKMPLLAAASGSRKAGGAEGS